MRLQWAPFLLPRQSWQDWVNLSKQWKSTKACFDTYHTHLCFSLNTMTLDPLNVGHWSLLTSPIPKKESVISPFHNTSTLGANASWSVKVDGVSRRTRAINLGWQTFKPLRLAPPSPGHQSPIINGWLELSLPNFSVTDIKYDRSKIQLCIQTNEPPGKLE